MAHGKAGRRPAAELTDKERCHGRSRTGPCGNPATVGAYCVHHLGPKDAKAQASTGERLKRLTAKALDRLEAILDDGPPDAQIRAAKIILDRTAPASGPHAIVVQVGPAAHDGHVVTSRELLDQRMAELRRRTAEIAEPETQASASDLEIIDAEIVEETSEPVTSQQGWEPQEFGETREYVRDPVQSAPKRENAGPTVVVPPAFGVPRVTSRPADFDRMAADRFG